MCENGVLAASKPSEPWGALGQGGDRPARQPEGKKNGLPGAKKMGPWFLKPLKKSVKNDDKTKKTVKKRKYNVFFFELSPMVPMGPVGRRALRGGP